LIQHIVILFRGIILKPSAARCGVSDVMPDLEAVS